MPVSIPDCPVIVRLIFFYKFMLFSDTANFACFKLTNIKRVKSPYRQGLRQKMLTFGNEIYFTSCL